jgi:hypothetical protein
VPAADDGSTGPRVPGTLHLRYAVPGAGAGSPGSLPIAQLAVSVDGKALAPVAVAPGQTVLCDAAPAPFAVGEHRSVQVVSTYRDAADNVSEPETIAVKAFDARSPRFVPTSPVLLWTGAPDATGQAELALRWQSQAGAASYRVYLGDARRLAGELGIVLPDGPVRSEQAKPIHDVSASLADKRHFSFLGEAPGAPNDDGLIHFRSQIPGSLRTVQFVRIVPLSAGGAETPFQTCGLVPIAVPGSNRPPIPALAATTGPTAGLTLTIRASGLRSELLDAAPTGPPEFRLRRTRTSGTHRPFVPVWRTGTLSVSGDGIWMATVTIPATELEPFVRTVWLAEVRYPADPPIPPGVVAVPVDGAVEPIWSTLGSAARAIWSDLSLAAESLLIPPDGPSAPVAPTLVHNADGTNALTVTGLPVAHPAAIAPYRLEIYRAAAGAAFAFAGIENVLGEELTWSDLAPAAADARYSVVVIDPIGRRSPAATAAISPK